MLANLINYGVEFSYLGFFVYLSSLGYVVPIPEEVILAVIGFLAGAGKVNIYLALIFSVGGVILGDNIFYRLASNRNRYVLHLLERLPSEKLERYHSFMERNILLSLIVMRFLVGVRFLGPVLAGTAGISWKKFFIYDLTAVTLYISGFIYLGYMFADEIEWVIKEIEWFRHLVVIGIFAVLLGWIFNYYRAKIIKRNK